MSEEKYTQRLEDSAQLVEDFNLHNDAEFFIDPSNRVEFLKSLEYDDFLSISRHVNTRLRGEEPRHGTSIMDQGASLPQLRTPDAGEKPTAYRTGFDVISKYLHESNDTDEQKLKGAAMAVEALIVWVHPFNDGNGRTSRFLGKFIENGTTDMDKLISETANGNERARWYGGWLRVDDTTDYDSIGLRNDLMMSASEIEEAKANQEKITVVDGIALSVDRLLKDKSLQEKFDEYTERERARNVAALEIRNRNRATRGSEPTS